MLNNIPTTLNKAARQTVLRHPNAYYCQLFRQAIQRTAPESVGGLPTLGGLGVLSSDDEENISWARVGNGYALPIDAFTPAQMMDRQDANNGDAETVRFLVEPEALGAATPQKLDVLYLAITDSVRVAFEIVAIETTSNIPPFTQRYVCNRRSDLAGVLR